MEHCPRKRINRREFMIDAGVLVGAGALDATGLERGRGMDEKTEGMRFLHDTRRHWVLGMDPGKGVTYFGLDSEETGRENTNLLSGPVMPTWTEADTSSAQWLSTEKDDWICSIPRRSGKGSVTWTIRQEEEDLVWKLEYAGEGTVENVRIALPINALLAAAVLIPAGLDPSNRGLGPWLLIAPDFGHLLVEAESPVAWFGINDGVRGGSSANAPQEGVDPRLRGQAWLDAVKLPAYKPGKLFLQFASEAPLGPGHLVTLRFRPQELSMPEGIPAHTWKRIRRAYLNHWQPCGTWCGPERTMVLANNVLSDPASISLWFYAEPTVLYPQPLPVGLEQKVAGSNPAPRYV